MSWVYLWWSFLLTCCYIGEGDQNFATILPWRFLLKHILQAELSTNPAEEHFMEIYKWPFVTVLLEDNKTVVSSLTGGTSAGSSGTLI